MKLKKLPYNLTVCWCGKKATHNAGIYDGKIIRDGAQVLMGDNESYVALCRKHFKLGMLKEEKSTIY